MWTGGGRGGVTDSVVRKGVSREVSLELRPPRSEGMSHEAEGGSARAEESWSQGAGAGAGLGVLRTAGRPVWLEAGEGRVTGMTLERSAGPGSPRV